MKATPAKKAAANDSARLVADEHLWELRERYGAGLPLEPVSYGTARDLADSTDHMYGLARASFDMKNLQRCWMVKAILGNVEAGSDVLEIGAGEPLVAGLLSRLGYRVTVVDPYDGSGNGPRELAAFRRAYPDVTFIHDRFPPARELEPEFAAVYSISVLEHVPLDQIEPLIEAIRQLLAPGEAGCSIHAIDHVIAGWGAEQHLAGLEKIAGASGLGQPLADALAQLEQDPETYFVSAEAHNRWRGDLEYDLYPMRRIASVHLFEKLA